jgi:tetratricopeptide (TPR) repeat protein
LARSPTIPASLHYLIHSYDFPPIAAQGLTAARRYASIAPSAPHALHMPSHIFTRQGLWEESIETNRRSAATSKSHFDSLHAMDYLEYAYLQGGRNGDAKRVLDEVAAIKKVDREHLVTAYALAAIPARYALELGRWADAARLLPHPNEKDFPWGDFPQGMAVLIYARALGAGRSGNAPAVREEIERLETLRKAMMKAKIAYWAQQADIQIKIASAWAAFAAGNKPEALKLMREGADMEDSSEKHPVTPGHVLPARELLGEMLLEVNQPALALKEFEASHKVEPNRFRGLYGAARAAAQLGDMAKAKTYYEKLVDLCRHADAERPELKEAKEFLAKK